MLPKHNHVSVKQSIQWNAPRALCSPERGAETDEPWTVRHRVHAAVFHAEACSADTTLRQRALAGGSEYGIDDTIGCVLLKRSTLCVAPSAGLVMTRSSTPVNRGIVRASVAAGNV